MNIFQTPLPTLCASITPPSDVGLRQASDQAHLDYARGAGRVLATGDADFLRLHAAGAEHASIAFVVPSHRSIGYMVERLRLLYEIMTPDEMVNTLEFL